MTHSLLMSSLQVFHKLKKNLFLFLVLSKGHFIITTLLYTVENNHKDLNTLKRDTTKNSCTKKNGSTGQLCTLSVNIIIMNISHNIIYDRGICTIIHSLFSLKGLTMSNSKLLLIHAQYLDILSKLISRYLGIGYSICVMDLFPFC